MEGSMASKEKRKDFKVSQAQQDTQADVLAVMLPCESFLANFTDIRPFFGM
jgi:hypothetical protein